MMCPSSARRIENESRSPATPAATPRGKAPRSQGRLDLHLAGVGDVLLLALLDGPALGFADLLQGEGRLLGPMLLQDDRRPPDDVAGEHRLHRVLAGRELGRLVVALGVRLDGGDRVLDLAAQVDEVQGDPRGHGTGYGGPVVVHEGGPSQDARGRASPASTRIAMSPPAPRSLCLIFLL